MLTRTIQPLLMRVAGLLVVLIGLVLLLNALLWSFLPREQLRAELRRAILEDVIQQENWDFESRNLDTFLNWDGLNASIRGVALRDAEGVNRIEADHFTAKISLWPLLILRSPALYQIDIDNSRMELDDASANVLAKALLKEPDEDAPELLVTLDDLRIGLSHSQIRLNPLTGISLSPTQINLQQAHFVDALHPNRAPKIELQGTLYDHFVEAETADKKDHKPNTPVNQAVMKAYVNIKKLPTGFSFTEEWNPSSLDSQIQLHQVQLNHLAQWLNNNHTLWPIPSQMHQHLATLTGQGTLQSIGITHKPSSTLHRHPSLSYQLLATRSWSLSSQSLANQATSLSAGPVTLSGQYQYTRGQPDQLKHFTTQWESTHHTLDIEARAIKPSPKAKGGKSGSIARGKQNSSQSGTQHTARYNVQVSTLKTDLTHTPRWLWQQFNLPVSITPPQGTLEGAFTTEVSVNDSQAILDQLSGVVQGHNLKTTLRPNYQALRPSCMAIDLQALKVEGKGKHLFIQQAKGTLGDAPFSLSGEVTPAQSTLNKVKIQAQDIPVALLGWAPAQTHQQQQDFAPWQLQGSTSLDATIVQSSASKPADITGSLRLNTPSISANGRQFIALPTQSIELQGGNAPLSIRGTLLRFPFTLNGPVNWHTQQLHLNGHLPHVVWDKETQGAIRDLQQVVNLGELPEFLNDASGEGEATFTVTGHFTNPEVGGKASFHSQFVRGQTNLPILGEILWGPEGVSIPKLQATLGNGYVDIDGNAASDGKTYQGQARLTNVPLEEVLALLQSISPEINSANSPVNQLKSLQGYVNGTVRLNKARNNQSPQYSGSIQSKAIKARLSGVDEPLHLTPFELAFNSASNAQLKPSRLSWGPLQGCLDGNIELGETTPQFVWDMETYPIPLSSWKTNATFYKQLSQQFHFPYPQPQAADTMTGYVSLYTRGSNTQALADVTLRDVTIETASAVPLSDPTVSSAEWAINHLNGTIQLSTQLTHGQFNRVTISSNQLTGQLQHGPLSQLAINGEWNLAQRHGKMDLAGQLLPTPSNTDATGHLATLDLKTELNEQGNAHLHDSVIELANMGKILIDGDILGVMTAHPTINASITTPNPLNMASLTSDIIQPLLPLNSPLRGQALLTRANEGTLDLNVHVVDTPEAGRMIDGEVTFDKVAMPLLNLRQLDGRIRFDGLSGHFDINRLRLPGIDLSLTGTIEDVLMMPWELTEVDVKGPLFAIPAWEKYVDEIINNRLIAGVMLPLLGPSSQTDELPLQFHDGKIAFDEVIYDNLIISDVTGNMLLGSSGYFELTDTQAKVASGDVKANIAMQPYNNNFIRADITANHVKANALAQTLLNAPNQIFGDLNGNIQFSTQGNTQEEQMKQVNGTANFSITNGRLPSIAKLETVLTAANILRGGVVGLNLNNLFRVMAPFNTNYFAELSGSLTMTNGVAYTNDILSDGENLDLLIQGSSNLYDGTADLTLYGDMSQNVNGRLGHLGRFSLNSLLKHIPGIGYVPGFKNRSGLIQYLPGVGYVPGLGGPVDDKSRFEVKLQGSIIDPRSIQDFNWVH